MAATAAVLAGALAACGSSGGGGTSSTAASNGIAAESLKLQVNVPTGSDMTSWVNKWIAAVQQQSGGKIKITQYMEAQLYTPADSLPATTSGALDMNFIDVGSMQGYLPAFTADVLPLIGLTDAQLEKYTGTGTPLFTALTAAASAKQLHLMPTGGWISGNQSLLMKQPISSLAGIKGRKIRSIGGLYDTVLQNLGASPIDLTSTDVPTALQTNTVDGASGAVSVFNTTWQGLGKQDVDLGSYSPVMYVMIVNSSKWASMPTADQNILNSTLESTYAQFGPQAQALETQQESAFAEVSGQDVYRLSTADQQLLRQASDPVWTSFKSSQPSVYAAALATAKSLGITTPSS